MNQEILSLLMTLNNRISALEAYGTDSDDELIPAVIKNPPPLFPTKLKPLTTQELLDLIETHKREITSTMPMMFDNDDLVRRKEFLFWATLKKLAKDYYPELYEKVMKEKQTANQTPNIQDTHSTQEKQTANKAPNKTDTDRTYKWRMWPRR